MELGLMTILLSLFNVALLCSGIALCLWFMRKVFKNL